MGLNWEKARMDNTLFTGELVRLCADEPAVLAKAFGRWGHDSEYLRLLSTEPARIWSEAQIKKWIEKEREKPQPEFYGFSIHTLEDDRLIGDIGLDMPQPPHGDTFVGIGLGDRAYWDQGYGTDAMRIMLGYAFMELGLHRLSLNVFEYNPRAIRSYQKLGFVEEGRQREFLNREGRRWDMVYMGILREEWEQRKERQ